MLNTHKVALMGVLTAATIVIAIIESYIPNVGIPGVKFGLANIMILVTLFELGVGESIFISIARVIVIGLARGSIFSMTFLMSLTGAVFSLGIMILFHLIIKKFSIIGISVIGALFHVLGQIIIAMLFLESAYVLFYLPIIALSAIITGIFVGVVSMLIIKTGVIKKQRERYNF